MIVQPISFQAYLRAEKNWPKKYFSLPELLRSDDAFALGLQNLPTLEELDLLEKFTNVILNPIRGRWGSPLGVHSCFREDALNSSDLVGGSDTSDHLFHVGGAADLCPEDSSRDGLWKFLSMISRGNVTFDQAILYPTFVHVGWRRTGNRFELRKLVMDGDKKTWPLLTLSERAKLIVKAV